ncbi:unnamed protein product [Ostreobium quekettii]|uniref:Uncharacterized protein n=1 Tax=Ostreobium quekettii TaxID=121088 RepID=A0A8S1INR3_9CHLO|nr:unnamed protein product [Ostreobium quekettii]
MMARPRERRPAVGAFGILRNHSAMTLALVVSAVCGNHDQKVDGPPTMGDAPCGRLSCGFARILSLYAQHGTLDCRLGNCGTWGLVGQQMYRVSSSSERGKETVWTVVL